MGCEWDNELSSDDALKDASTIHKENSRRDHDRNDGYTGLCQYFDTVSGAGSFTTPMIGSKTQISDYIEKNTEKWGVTKPQGLIVYWMTHEDSHLHRLRRTVWDLRQEKIAAHDAMLRAATLKMRTKKTIKCSGCGSCIATSHIHLDRGNKCPVCEKPELVRMPRKKSLDTQIKKAEGRVYAREKLLREKSEVKRRKIEAANTTRTRKKELPPLFDSGVCVEGYGPY